CAASTMHASRGWARPCRRAARSTRSPTTSADCPSGSRRSRRPRTRRASVPCWTPTSWCCCRRTSAITSGSPVRRGTRSARGGRPGPGVTTLVGDGLGCLSDFRFDAVEHVRWVQSYGLAGDYTDELAAKGFALATMEVAPGVCVDIYDLHADAGDSDGDRRAR